MKVVIFAGGLGTRLMEETEARPKPMVEIGGKPILWHIMKIYEKHGFKIHGRHYFNIGTQQFEYHLMDLELAPQAQQPPSKKKDQSWRRTGPNLKPNVHKNYKIKFHSCVSACLPATAR